MKGALFFILILALGIHSCKEDTDENPPIISLSQPTENISTNVLEEIDFRANITDDEILTSVSISLISYETGNRVLRSASFQPNASVFELKYAYFLEDSLLKGGNYYFRIEAQDKNNSTTVFRDITIGAFPRRKLSCIAICSDDNSSFLYEDLNDFQFSIKNIFPNPYLSAELNNVDQQLWFVPRQNNTITAINLRDKSTVFEKSYTSNFSTIFSTTEMEERSFFVSLKTGELQGYDASFKDNYTYFSQEQKILEEVSIGSKFILQEEVFATNNGRTIQILNRNSGALQSSIPSKYSLVEAYFFEEQSAILFQNDSQGGLIQELNVSPIGTRIIRSMNDTILSVEQVNTNEYLISTKTTLFLYNLSTDNLVTYLTVQNAIVRYDVLNNQLYIGSNNLLSLYNYRQGGLLFSTNFASNIKDILIRYNY